jgi:hypothetical protein
MVRFYLFTLSLTCQLGCRKGNRECIYPEPPAPKGPSSQSAGSKDASGSTTQTASPTSSGDEEDDDDRDIKLDPIPDDDEDEPIDAFQPQSKSFSMPRRTSTTSFSSSSNLHRVGSRQDSETPSQDETKSSSPSASTGTTSSLTMATHQLAEFSLPASLGPAVRPDWSQLPADFRHYLNYFSENITNYHYCMVADSDGFFRTILPNIAIRNDALLYAVVGFAAYHQTLQNPNGKIQEFLQYYNKSVTILLNFLKRKEKHNIATLLTILQLATIEVRFPAVFLLALVLGCDLT